MQTADDDPRVADHTLALLRAMRRERDADRETQLLILRNLNRLTETFNKWTEHVERTFSEFRSNIHDLRSDVALLEMHNITRQDELMRVLRKLEGTDDD